MLPEGADVSAALDGGEGLCSKAWTNVLGKLRGCKRWDLAVSCLTWLRTEGLEGNEYHCSAAISACEKGGHWREALGILRGMTVLHGAVPNTFCYSAAMSTCERGGECRKVIDLLSEMRREGVQPNHFCYSAAIRACARA